MPPPPRHCCPQTQHLRDPLTAANAVYREGGFKRFFAGGYAAMWSLPWELMIHAASEGIMLVRLLPHAAPPAPLALPFTTLLQLLLHQ